MIRFLFALAALAAPALGQSAGAPCSDTTVALRATHIAYGSATECSGTVLTVGNTTLHTTRNKCPQLVVVTPAHYAPKHQDGCGTDAQVHSQSPIITYQFRCSGHYLLFLRLTSECVMVDKQITGMVPNYTTVPCGLPARDLTSTTAPSDQD